MSNTLEEKPEKRMLYTLLLCTFCQSIQFVIPSGVVSNVMPSQPFGNHAFIFVLATAPERG